MFRSEVRYSTVLFIDMSMVLFHTHVYMQIVISAKKFPYDTGLAENPLSLSLYFLYIYKGYLGMYCNSRYMYYHI